MSPEPLHPCSRQRRSSRARSASRSRSRSTAGRGWSLAFGARHDDLLELAALEEAFGADGAIVLATRPDDWHELAARYGGESIRFPILCEIEERRRITIVVDPGGVVRHVGLRRSARETLTALEELVAPAIQIAA